jgi:YD repeat-containing protein
VYDGANRLRVEIAGAGSAVEARTTHWYDGSGNRVRTKGPRGTWAYDLLVDPDDLGRPVRTVDALGNATTRAFDGAGNVLCEKRPLGGDPLAGESLRGKSLGEVETLACAGPQVTRYRYL